MIDFEQNAKNIEEQEKADVQKDEQFNFGILYVGLLFVVLGIIYFFTARNVSALKLLVTYSQLWPLALIALGLSMFSAKTSKMVAIGFFVTVLAVITTVSTVLVQDGNEDQTIVQESFAVQDPAQVGQINIENSAGKLTVQGGITAGLMQTFYESNYANLLSDENVKDSLQVVNLSSKPDFWQGIGGYYKNLTARLTTETPLSLSVDGTATDISMDLSDVLVENLDLNINASDVALTMGDGLPEGNISINATASTITIIYPDTVGVEIISNPTISSYNFEGFEVASDGLVYRSEGYDAKPQKSRLSIDYTVSRVTVVQQ